MKEKPFSLGRCSLGEKCHCREEGERIWVVLVCPHWVLEPTLSFEQIKKLLKRSGD